MSLQAGRLLTCLLVTCVCVCRGLDIIFDRTPDNRFCAQLLCDEDISQSDEHISYLTELAIYNVTFAQAEVKLASVSLFQQGLYIEASKADVINGTGRISSSEGHLALSFQDVADCFQGKFLCQLEFVTVNGEPGTITKSTISGDSGHCYNLTIENAQLEVKVTQLSDEKVDLQTRLENATQRADNQTIEIAALEAKVTQLQTRLENATQRIALLEALVNASTVKPQVPGPPCYKGMPSTTSRQEFLLWGRVPALCDTETDGGGWVVIQRRTKGDVDFYRGWEDYKNGFGTPDTDYWIGLEVIHNLTSQGYSQLRFDLQYIGQNYSENYSDFAVADELSKYQLSVGEYNGTAGDSFTYHSGMKFSTYVSDNDVSAGNCASQARGAWWYGNCYSSNLNGQWGTGDNVKGVFWNSLSGTISLNSTEIKVRQVWPRLSLQKHGEK
ncbi:hypothetical protein BsWGS_23999 [Bradybaena similaris]